MKSNFLHFFLFIPYYVEFFLVIAAILLLIICQFSKTFSSEKQRYMFFAWLAHKLTLLSLFASLFCKIWNIIDFDGNGFLIFLINFNEITMAWYFTVFILFFSLLLLLIPIENFFTKYENLKNVFSVPELYAYLLLVIGVMCSIIQSENLANTFILIELQSLMFFVLAALGRENSLRIEASIKYFIIGGFASALLIFGMVLLYLTTGSFLYAEIYQILHFYSSVDLTLLDAFNGYYYFGVFFFLTGVLIKMGVAPLHWWVIEIYQSTFKWIVVFFAVVSKLPLAYLLYFLYNYIFLVNSNNLLSLYCTRFFLVIAFFSLILSAIGAISTTNLWGIFGYSAVANGGFFILGTLYSTPFVYLIFTLFYSLSVLGAILSTLYIEQEFAYKNKLFSFNLFFNILSSSVYARAFLGFIIIAFLFSLAGMPPFIGFYAKFLIYLAIIQKIGLSVAILGLVLSILVLLYYLRIIEVISFPISNRRHFTFYKTYTWGQWYLLAFILFLFLLFSMDFFSIWELFEAFL